VLEHVLTKEEEQILAKIRIKKWMKNNVNKYGFIKVSGEEQEAEKNDGKVGNKKKSKTMEHKLTKKEEQIIAKIEEWIKDNMQEMGYYHDPGAGIEVVHVEDLESFLQHLKYGWPI